MATVTGSQRNKVLVVDTVNTGQGANELYAMNQNVRTSDNVTFNNVTIAGSISGYATESYVGTQISNLVDSSPSTLNTLNELAAALGDDPNFATTVSNSIGTKWTQDNTRISNWNTAYGWGNHASAGYTSNVGDITAVAAGSGLSGGGTSGTVTVNVGAGDGIDTTVNTVAVDSTVIRTTGNQTLGGIKTFSSEIVATGGNSRNWNTAYGWGNHASGGYSTLTSNETVSGFKTFTHSSGIKYNGTAASPLWLNRSSGTNVNIRLSSSSSGTTYVGQGASAGTLKVGTTADLIGAGNTVWHTGTLTTTNKANYDTAYGWGNHASAGYITASNSAITNKLPLAGGTMTGQLTLSGSSPQLKFTDTTSGADDFWIHCNSDRFYVLTDRDDNGSWDGSHPLELTNSNSQGYLYGARLFAENYHPNADKWTTARTITLGGDLTGNVSIDGSANVTLTATVADGSGSGLDADLLDGQHGSYYYAASNPNGYTSNVGDITAVAAGSGLSGGGTSGTVTVNVGAGDGIDTTVNTVAVDSTVIRTTGNQTLGGIKTFSSEIVANAGVDVSGNVVLTGTVDGRDVAADGTKLDGIEANATADQTAAEILTAIKTVDGSGSGLDADTVDGLHSSGIVETSDGTAGNLDTEYDAQMFGWTPSTTGRPASNFGQGISIVSSGKTHNNSNNWITQLGFGTTNTTSYFRTKVNTGGWSDWRTIWNSSNDGSGSGLRC